ncbi:MAG: hypothetical protein ACD_40C00179G0005 [uncultured bacterium]|nr:MAG: hypothetical protein ACD_40C00179G0005 [uncultured bacterium]
MEDNTGIRDFKPMLMQSWVWRLLKVIYLTGHILCLVVFIASLTNSLGVLESILIYLVIFSGLELLRFAMVYVIGINDSISVTSYSLVTLTVLFKGIEKWWRGEVLDFRKRNLIMKALAIVGFCMVLFSIFYRE